MCLASGVDVEADRFDAWMGQTGEGWPTAWGVREGRPVPVHYAMDPGADRKALRRAFESLPVLELTLDPDDLLGVERGIYSHPMESGEAWERKARIRWTGPGGPTEKGFETACGVRIQGGWNRRPEESPKHSLRLVFRGRYGAPRLEHPLFGGGSGSFETLVLRGGNNNSWLHWSGEERRRADYLRDEWMRRSHAAMGHPAPRGRFVHLALNGLYWGVYNLVERPDEHFVAERLGGRPADWDSRNADKVLSGDDTAWRRLMAMAPAAEDPGVWAEIRGLLDVPAFIDYMVLNLYGANGDWDGASNWYAARRRIPAGGFRFFVWDGERTLESPEDSRIAEDAAESPSWIFQRLRKNAEFRRAFGLRARELLGPVGPLSAGAAAERFRALASELETAMPAEAARWGAYRATVQPYKTGPFERYGVESHWKPEIRRLVEQYFPRRGVVFASQLTEAGLLE
jgi:hypothetical protein